MIHFRDYETILFDLDGTLSDSKVGIIRCLQYSLEKFNIRETDIDKLTRYIGPSLSHTYQECYGLSKAQAKQATAFYRERFEAVGIKENVLFSGVYSLLRELRSAGKNIVLATAKPTIHAEKILKSQNVAVYFNQIVGSNLDGTRENKCEVIAFALEGIKGLNRSKTVMVGDRYHDILGAKENRLPVIGVTYGYGTVEEIMTAKPDAIASTVAQLRQLLL